MEFCLVNGEAATFLLEEECYSGVAKIAEKVCGDVELVTGIRPVTRRISKTYLDEQKESEYVVLVAHQKNAPRETHPCTRKDEIIHKSYPVYHFPQ